MLRLAKASWLLCICAFFGTASAERWEIVRDGNRTEARFLSKATMESFEGVTDNVEGWVALTSNGETDSISWRISVDLASLDTGIGLRNRHMRENHLHTDEYPNAVFSGSMEWPVEVQRLEQGSTADLELAGQLDLHGVSRERVIPVSLSLVPDGSVQASASFGVSLADHQIPLPKFLLLKLADLQQVQVQILAKRQRGAP